MQPIPTTDPSDAGSRSASLDGIRAIAALMIVVGHSVQFVTVPSEMPEAVSTGIGRANNIAVELFFILSGLLLAAEWWRRREGARWFLWRRFARVIPLYAVVVLCSAIYAALVSHLNPLSLLHQVTLTQVFAWQVPPLVPQAWTLNLEAAYYLVLPLLLVLLAASGKGRRPVMALAALAALAWLVRPALEAANAGGGRMALALTIADLWPFFLCGVGMALCKVRFVPRPRVTIASLAGLGLVLVAPSQLIESLSNRGGLLLTALLGTLLVWSTPAFGRSLAWVGRVSYSVYLWHWLVILMLGRHTPLADLQPGLFAIVILTVTLPLSYLSWRGIELSAQRALLRLRRPRSEVWTARPSVETGLA